MEKLRASDYASVAQEIVFHICASSTCCKRFALCSLYVLFNQGRLWLLNFLFLSPRPSTVHVCQFTISSVWHTKKSLVIARELLGSEYDGRRIIGLLDCTSEEQFDKELKVTKRQWPEAFTIWLHSIEGRLWPLFARMHVTTCSRCCWPWKPAKTNGKTREPRHTTQL